MREKIVKEEDDLIVEVEADTRPSDSEVFAGFETALKWMSVNWSENRCNF